MRTVKLIPANQSMPFKPYPAFAATGIEHPFLQDAVVGVIGCPYAHGNVLCGLWCPKFQLVQGLSHLDNGSKESKLYAVQNCGSRSTELEIEPWE